MSIVVLKLPEVKVEAGRPTRCPVCKGETFQRWGGKWKALCDHEVKAVRVNRYRFSAKLELMRKRGTNKTKRNEYYQPRLDRGSWAGITQEMPWLSETCLSRRAHREALIF